MPMSRLELARAFSGALLAADPAIVAVFVIGSAARGDGVELSDIDVRLIVDSEAETGAAHLLRAGLFFDVERVHPAAFGDAEALLADPYLAGAVREAVILYDRDGAFTRVQRQVAEQFAEARWLRARLSPLVEKIDANRARIDAAIAADDPVELFRQGAFALWNLSDALLVSQGRSPSWVRGLQKLVQVLPEEHARIVELENSGNMTAEDVAALLPFFTDPDNDDPVLAHVEREIAWMVHHDLHREALHSLWARSALMLDGQMQADESRTRAFCHDWLHRLGWAGDRMPERRRQLEECAARLRRRLDAIG
jgi:predicted nucleotidyltransferase